MNPVEYLKKLEDMFADDPEKLFERMEELCKRNTDNPIDYNNELSKVIGYYQMMSLVLQMLRVWNIDKKIFHVSQDLIEALSHTDVPTDLTPGDFHFPFQTFAFTCPDNFFKIEQRGGSEKINLIVVGTDITSKDSGKQIQIKGLSNHGALIYTCINNDVSFSDPRAKNPGAGSGEVQVLDDEHTALINIVFNLCLYINDPMRIITETEEHITQKCKQSKGLFRPYIYLKAPKSYKALFGHTGKVMDKHFLVRGFYKNQPYGLKNSLRKLIWVKPFWKGSMTAELSNKIYKV